MEVKSRIAQAKTSFMNKRNLMCSKNMNVSMKKWLIKVHIRVECRTTWMRIMGIQQSGEKVP